MMKSVDYYLVLPNATRKFHFNNKVDEELCSRLDGQRKNSLRSEKQLDNRQLLGVAITPSTTEFRSNQGSRFWDWVKNPIAPHPS